MLTSQTLENLRRQGNYRELPPPEHGKRQGLVDLSTNDYLGIGRRVELQEEFFAEAANRALPMTSSASRLLATEQEAYYRLESKLSALYQREALLFNSGYHANTGLIPAIADKGLLVIADRLAHASIIDGIILSRAPFVRYRHGDYDHLESILERRAKDYERVLIVTESVFSMDGDSADIDRLAEIKSRHRGALLYVDEAHAFGVAGRQGLGLSISSRNYRQVDLIVGTFGKAAASAGAFCAMSRQLKELAVNKSRSLIFSTALPPICCGWTSFILDKMTAMDTERERLRLLAKRLGATLCELTGSAAEPSHIQPLILGDPFRAAELSRKLLDERFKVLPIRSPAVPAGTERLRFSLSAAMTPEEIEALCRTLKRLQA